jgi:hypothetical protein
MLKMPLRSSTNCSQVIGIGSLNRTKYSPTRRCWKITQESAKTIRKCVISYIRRGRSMTQREKYVQYLRDQAQSLCWLADEIENGEKITTDWLIDWQLKEDRELLDAQQVYAAELEQAAGLTKPKEVA